MKKLVSILMLLLVCVAVLSSCSKLPQPVQEKIGYYTITYDLGYEGGALEPTELFRKPTVTPPVPTRDIEEGDVHLRGMPLGVQSHARGDLDLTLK